MFYLTVYLFCNKKKRACAQGTSIRYIAACLENDYNGIILIYNYEIERLIVDELTKKKTGNDKSQAEGRSE